MDYSKAKKEIVVTLEDLKRKIIENHKRAGQVASGSTIKSIRIEETEDGAKLVGRRYFGTLETGRKPGKTPRNFNEIIQNWILDKGIKFKSMPYKRRESNKWHPKYTPQLRGLMSLSSAIAHKIMTDGTKLYRSGGRDDIYTKPTEEAIKDIKQKLAGIFKTEIERL